MAESGTAARAAGPMTVAEFVDFDDGTETRLELVHGELVAMSPPSGRHVILTANLFECLIGKLQRPCRPLFGGGVALSDDGDEYRLPDVFVSCTPVPDTYFAEPRFFLEVLSPSTASDDRTKKLDFYKSFASAEAILYVWQDVRRLELHLRQPQGWLVTDAIGQGTVTVPGLDVSLTLEEIYAGL